MRPLVHSCHGLVLAKTHFFVRADVVRTDGNPIRRTPSVRMTSYKKYPRPFRVRMVSDISYTTGPDGFG
jgi:hypothetical protein